MSYNVMALKHPNQLDFADAIGWASWMDDYCENPESPTEEELAKIDNDLKGIWADAWEEYILSAIRHADYEAKIKHIDELWDIFVKINSSPSYEWSGDVLYNPDKFWNDGDLTFEIIRWRRKEITISPEFDEDYNFWEELDRDNIDYAELRKHLVDIRVYW